MRHASPVALISLLLIIPTCSASVLISEVFYDAVGSDDSKEFVELYNPTSQDINITGWEIEMGNGYDGSWDNQATILGIISAYSFFLIGEKNVSGADIETNLELQNGPDAVRIKDDSGAVIDTVGYGDLGYPELYEGTPMIDVSEGHSIERKPGYLNPSGGNGQDTNNNSADFLDREEPEPQNSGQKENNAAGSVLREISPLQNSYLPGTTISISLLYSFNEQVGLIVRETSPFDLLSPSPEPDYQNQASGLFKWLIKNKPIPDGAVTYSVVLPPSPGKYTITGDWQSVDIDGYISSGSTGDTEINIISETLQGFVEDVLGSPLESAEVSMENTTTLTNKTGYYSLPLPDTGVHDINASKSGYLPESETINISSLPEIFFNFTGNHALIPELVYDTGMLSAVSRWASDILDDDKILEVVHQWASTPE